ncbi:MAG: hypothetical protein IBJ11_02210 [Phycisphaerales bacterium]|nr:hypothetical protein [Phycisphaerales bacterium]
MPTRTAICLAIGLLLVGGRAAPGGEGGPAPADRRPTMSVSIGFAGATFSEVWNPLRVAVTGGLDPVEGMAVASISRQNRRIMTAAAPFVATPGQTTYVDLGVVLPLQSGWMPAGTDVSIDVALVDAAGRRFREARLATDPRGADLQMSPTLRHARENVVVVGDVGLPEVARAAARAAAPVEKDAENPDGTADRGPQLESATIVVVSPGDLPAKAALYEGVGVLVADARAFERLPDRASEAVRSWVRAGGRMAIVGPPPGRWVDGVAGPGVLRVDSVAQEGLLSVAKTVLRLGPEGQSRGWTLSDLSGDVALASGPVGFGWLAVLSAAPRNDLTSKDAWESVLEDLGYVPPEVDRRRSPETQMPAPLGFRNGVLDALLAVVRPADPVPYWLLPLPILALAILVGPIDRLVLRRTGRLQWSWATALVWVALFSAFGWLLPHWLRTGPSRSVRTECIDSTADDPTSRRSGATAVFTSSQRELGIDGLPGGAWTRPLDSVIGYWSDEARLPEWRSRQGAGSTATANAGIWTFRAIADESEVPSAWSARVGRQPGEPGWRVEIRGPAGDVPAAAVLTTHNGTWALQPRAGSTGVFDTERREPETRSPLFIPSLRDEHGVTRAQAAVSPESAPLMLAGSIARTAGMRRAVGTGRYAVVMFTAPPPPPDVRVRESEYHEGATLYRLLVPIDPPEPSESQR